ncbi:OTU family ubiquitin thioesterase [Chlamydia avium]|uniref:Peptidase C65 Otubain family protein n=1 Tax=Chlamydia avium 10DC88 TaxID=1229831 RepID=W8JQ33_9CHLA|nr:OTU family ubiquitin thioesterase [Chlamydia avium]AHK62963.1 Peptidase C65 Otubain family protein [Chlamydia avium 10DC88]
MSPTPPPCPPHGKNNFYHLQTCPQDPLYIRILRVIAYIMLHIITLGILLLIHYLDRHIIEDHTRSIFPVVPPKPEEPIKTEIPTTLGKDKQPTEDVPPPPSPGTKETSVKKIIQPKEKKAPDAHVKGDVPSSGSPPPTSLDTLFSYTPSTPPTKPDFLSRILSLGHLPKEVAPHSLQSLVYYGEQGLLPYSARPTLDILKTSNPTFLNTYPMKVKDIFLQTILNLQQKLQNTNPQSDEYLVANLQLKQLQYLDNNFYIIDVLGDGNCFYRACFVGWLSHLMRQNNPAVFAEEAERILSFPFASSSPGNYKVSKNMASLLHSCQNFRTLKDLFDLVLLSHTQTSIGVKYLRTLALFVTNCNRIQALGGEENLKALILGQLEDTLDLLLSSLRELMRIQPSSSVLTEMFSNTQPPPTTTTTQALLLLEFLQSLFSSEQQPSEQHRAAHSMLQELTQSCSSILTAAGITNDHAEKVVTFLPKELHIHYTRFSETLHQSSTPTPPPTNIVLTAFLLCHPSCINHNTSCDAYMKLARSALQTHLDKQTDICEFLNCDQEQSAVINSILKECWSHKLSICALDSLLSLPEGIQGTLVIPQLEHIFMIILRLLSTAPPSLLNLELKETNSVLLSSIQFQPQLTLAFSVFLSAPLFGKLDETPMEKEYAQSIRLFFFILQHPLLLRDPDPNVAESSKKLLSTFFPYLQQALRKHSNHKKLEVISETLWGLFCSCPPKLDSEINPQVVESTVMFLIRYPVTLSLCDPKLQQAILDIVQSSSSHHAARELIRNIKAQYLMEWNAFIKHLNTVGRRSSQEYKTRLSSLLPKELLLTAFLNHYPQIWPLSSTLGQQCQAYLEQQTNKIRQELLANNQLRWQKLIIKNCPRLSIYNKLQNSFLLSTLRPTAYPMETRLTILHQLEQLHVDQLTSIFDSITSQAEDEHVSALSSSLGFIGLCQYLADTSLSQTPSQLTPLSTTHGFLQLDYSPEDRAHIHIFRAFNHYNCLLRKDAEDTSRLENNE